MAFTQAQFDAISDAIASGVLEVTVNGQTVRYQSTKDMLALRDRMQRELQTAAGTGRPVARTARFLRD